MEYLGAGGNYAKKTSGSGRSAECAAFISEFYRCSTRITNQNANLRNLETLARGIPTIPEYYRFIVVEVVQEFPGVWRQESACENRGSDSNPQQHEIPLLYRSGAGNYYVDKVVRGLSTQSHPEIQPINSHLNSQQTFQNGYDRMVVFSNADFA